MQKSIEFLINHSWETLKVSKQQALQMYNSIADEDVICSAFGEAIYAIVSDCTDSYKSCPLDTLHQECPFFVDGYCTKEMHGEMEV